jgi:tetratricopeptide (TPR) repeat protein
MTTVQLLSGQLEEQENHYSLKQWSPARHLPYSLRDLLQTRLDQFEAGDREVAQVCSVIGSDVTPHFVASVLGERVLDRTESSLERLAEAGFFLRDPFGQSYSIRHALIQNAAYESMLKATRARFHRRVAELLQGNSVDGFRAPPELIAEHFTQAGLLDIAAPRWLQSAQHALGHSAVAEAVALARRGLAVLAEVEYPPSLREVRIGLVTTLGTALVASKGFASVEAAAAFREAESLLAGVDDPPKLFPALWGLCITHLMRGQLNPALDYATRMIEIGRVVPGGNFLIEALWTRGAVLFWLGRLDEAEAHLTEAVDMYRPAHHANAHLFGQDPGVAARVYLMQLRAFRLQAHEAAECASECLLLARRLRHPHSLAWALAGGAMVRLLLGDVDGTLAEGPQTIEYCMQQEHPFWLAATKMMTGWALTQRERVVEGLTMAREGFALYEMLGTSLISPVFCALLADCCSTAGDPVEAASWAARGRDMVERNNERLSLSTILITDGQLMQRAGGAEAAHAESCYREALECARGQGATLREIQAAALLAQMLAAQGSMPDAIAVLTPYAPLITSPAAPAFLRPLAALFGAPVADDRAV